MNANIGVSWQRQKPEDRPQAFDNNRFSACLAYTIVLCVLGFLDQLGQQGTRSYNQMTLIDQGIFLRQYYTAKGFPCQTLFEEPEALENSAFGNKEEIR